MNAFLRIFLVFYWLALTACAMDSILGESPFNADEAWVILPFTNQSDNPEAAEQATDLTETMFRFRIGENLAREHSPDISAKTAELFQEKNYRYGLTGSVREWRLAEGVEPTVSVNVTMQVIELATGSVEWSKSGAKTGTTKDGVNGVGLKLISELIERLPLTQGINELKLRQFQPY